MGDDKGIGKPPSVYRALYLIIFNNKKFMETLEIRDPYTNISSSASTTTATSSTSSTLTKMELNNRSSDVSLVSSYSDSWCVLNDLLKTSQKKR
jgi:hypothetical protein